MKGGPEASNASIEGKTVYLLSADSSSADEVSLVDLWERLWAGRIVVLAACAVATVAAIAYALMATEWYRAEVVLIPSRDDSNGSIISRLGGLGALAGLPGIGLVGSDGNEALAVLQSREFARSFIQDRDLVTVLLYEEWDAARGRWKSVDPEDQPDIRDAVFYFLNDVRDVTRDTRTGLVTLSVSWLDAEVAADWAMDLVSRLNETMRQRALNEAERNIAYLQGELASSNLTALQSSIARVLEMELQKLMLARGNQEFAFRVVDPAQVPRLRDWPRRSLIVALGALLGAILGAAIVLIRGVVDGRRASVEA